MVSYVGIEYELKFKPSDYVIGEENLYSKDIYKFVIGIALNAEKIHLLV